MFQPTNPPTHPPTHQTKNHGWESLHRFQIFKQNRNISIRSSLIAILLLFVVPPGGVGVVELGGGTPQTCAHLHAHAHMCAHTYMHVKHDKHGCLHGGGHLQFPNMFILSFRVCACV